MIEFSETREFDFLSSEYAGLFARSSATAFQHPLWLDRLYSRLISGLGHPPVIITGRAKRDGRLVFVLPMVKRRYGPFSIVECADMGVSDYGSPVIDRDVVAALAGDPSSQRELSRAAGPFALSRLQKIRADSLSQLAVFGATRPTFMGQHAHPVALAAPFSAWRSQTLTESFRRFLDRKRKALGKKGNIKLEEVVGADAIAEAFRSLRHLREQRWPKDILRKEPYFDFYLEMARSGQASGLTRTYRFSCGGETAGVLFGLSYQRQFLFLLMGFDFNAYRNYSLGLLMLESAIEDCIERGDTVFDMTIGDEAYKADFNGAKIPMLAVWVGPEPIQTLTSLAFRCLVKLRELKAQSQALYQYALR